MMTTKPTQTAVIFCDPGRVVVASLIGELEAQLTNRAATILTYGVSLKQRDGFLVVEVVTGLPEVVVDWLKNHPRVKDFVIYDVPSEALESLATEQATTQGELPDLPPRVRQAVAELEQWLVEHHYKLIPDDDTGGLRLVADQKSHRKGTKHD